MYKYRNKKTRVGGKVFDSKLEANHYLELELLLKTGKIKDLNRQVRITLSDKPNGRQVVYIADFVYFDIALNAWVVMDSKGLKVQPYQTKRDWLLDKFNGFIFIEKTAKGENKFIPYGNIPLIFTFIS